MRKSENRFTLFEQEALLVGEEGFTEAHRKQLEVYGGSGTPYFRLVHRGVRFGSYVGVLQVGNLTIEILPKADKGAADAAGKGMWRSFLLRMLQSARLLPQTTEEAFLHLHPHSVLEVYFRSFLEQVRYLLQTGLTKQYRKAESNDYALRGRLLFAEQVRYNSVHAERFFTRHMVYNTDHVHNAVLQQTLDLICRLAPNNDLRLEAASLRSRFPDCRPVAISRETFEQLVYSRKTEGYQPAHRIARLLLLNYHPDVRSGENAALALLFDMNYLWEAYIAQLLRRQLQVRFPGRYLLRTQVATPFWKSGSKKTRKLYPDMVIVRADKEAEPVLVLDTKWKRPKGGSPSNADLRQMFAYNVFCKCSASALVYPAGAGKESRKEDGFFALNNNISCALLFLKLHPVAGVMQLDLLPVADMVDSICKSS